MQKSTILLSAGLVLVSSVALIQKAQLTAYKAAYGKMHAYASLSQRLTNALLENIHGDVFIPDQLAVDIQAFKLLNDNELL